MFLHDRRGPAESIPDRAQERREFNPSILILPVLLGVALVASRNITRGEFNLNVDEISHAATGEYVADFLHDLPLLHPARYTYEHYAQYPMLGVIHWPPFF